MDNRPLSYYLWQRRLLSHNGNAARSAAFRRILGKLTDAELDAIGAVCDALVDGVILTPEADQAGAAAILAMYNHASARDWDLLATAPPSPGDVPLDVAGRDDLAQTLRMIEMMGGPP